VTLSDILDWMNSGAAQAPGGNPSDIFHAYANPDAVLNSPVSQFAFSGSTKGLQDLQRRLMTGVEGLSGDAKYAALRDLASRLRAAQGVPDAAPGPSTVPPDFQALRDMMARLLQNRGL
jgi:hypothetical protein